MNVSQQLQNSLPSQSGKQSPPLPLSSAVQEALTIAKRAVDELLIESEFAQKLARSEASGKPLRIKLGLDPTAPDLHLGHTVVLNKMRQLQDLGHTVIFLIGDFTSMIGDPSGRNITRPPLTREQIEENAKTYFAQASLVLDPARTEIRYNSEWSDPLGARGMIQLSAKYTVARILEREDFTKRFKAGTPISVHELLYPLMQGYDSVALRSDLELGGTDQKFNLLVGRELQKDYGQEPQCILTMPLLEGLDGTNKMSKSLGNYIGIDEPAIDIVTKTMKIGDALMWRWIELLSFEIGVGEAKTLQADVAGGGLNPRDVKLRLARELAARFHDARAAETAIAGWNAAVRGEGDTDSLPLTEVMVPAEGLRIAALLTAAGITPSNSEASRKLKERSVRIDGEVFEDAARVFVPGFEGVLAVGKRNFARVRLVAA